MKRVFALMLLLLLLPGAFPACAETLRAQLNAPDTVSEMFASNSGKTEITFDAQVVVPEAEKIPVVAAERRPFTADEFVAAAEAVLGSGDYRPFGERISGWEYEDNANSSDPESVVVNSASGEYYAYCTMYRAFSGSMSYCQLFARPRDSAVTYWFGAPPCSILRGDVPQEVTERALQIAAQAAPELTLSMAGPVEGQTRDGGLLSDAGYEFVFTRSFAGIPSLYTFEDCTALDRADDLMYQIPFPYERMILIIGRDGHVWLLYNAPCRLGETLMEEAGLLSFAQILTIARQILPLKLAYKEKYLKEDQIAAWQIDRIELSYSRVQLRDQTQAKYALIPVWDFMDANEPDKSLLTLNAMDGTVIDRGFGY